MMNTFRTKPGDILFTHTDLDGVGCGILFKEVNGVRADVRYCGYDRVDEEIEKTLDRLDGKMFLPQIIISDLGIKQETAERLNRYRGKKVLLDHHETNEWLDDKYEWALIDAEASGTLLLYNYMADIPTRFRDFAVRVDDYDRWVHGYSESKRLNRLFCILGIERFETRCRLMYNPIKFSKTDELLLQIDSDNFNRYLNKLESRTVTFPAGKERKLGIVFADRYQSEAAHELMKRKKLDAIALIDPNSYKISFRSNGMIDVGTIAKRLGGGGHRCASGVMFNYKPPITDFHGSKYQLYGVWDSLENVKIDLAIKFSQELQNTESEAIATMMGGESDD